MKKTIRLKESELRQMIAESVRRVLNEGTLNELWGNSSPNGYEFDMGTGEVQRNQGGAFGGSGLDKMHDREKFEKEQQAKRFNDSQSKYKQWCYNNYDLVMSMCPGYMNGGEYEKAYRYCN